MTINSKTKNTQPVITWQFVYLDVKLNVEQLAPILEIIDQLVFCNIQAGWNKQLQLYLTMNKLLSKVINIYWSKDLPIT